MRFLADMNISLRTVQWLRKQGFDATHLREENLHKELDSNILIKARKEQRILLTIDLDFGYLLAASGEKLPSVVLFRLKNETSEAVNTHLNTVLNFKDLGWSSGLFVTVTEKMIRTRTLPF